METTHVSPYQLIKTVNKRSGRNLPTQMGYNYTRPNKKGRSLIPTELVDGRRMVRRDVAEAWIEKYLAKNG